MGNWNSSQRTLELRNLKTLVVIPLIGARDFQSSRWQIQYRKERRQERVTVTSGSLCTCVYSCVQCSLCGAAFAMYCWPIRSFRAESHAAHQVSPCLSHLFPPPCFAVASLPSGPRGDPTVPFVSLSSFPPAATAATAALRPTVPLRPNGASFLRPLGPQADSPGRLTELTVSTAGWLAGSAGVATQPATFLFSRVCAASRPGFTWRYLPACSLSSLTSLRATGSESSRPSRAPALDFKSLSFHTCLLSLTYVRT